MTDIPPVALVSPSANFETHSMCNGQRTVEAGNLCLQFNATDSIMHAWVYK